MENDPYCQSKVCNCRKYISAMYHRNTLAFYHSTMVRNVIGRRITHILREDNFNPPLWFHCWLYHAVESNLPRVTSGPPRKAQNSGEGMRQFWERVGWRALPHQREMSTKYVHIYIYIIYIWSSQSLMNIKSKYFSNPSTVYALLRISDQS